MAPKNPIADFFSQNDFGKLFEIMKSPAFDMKAFLEENRKNVQALTQTQQMAFQSLQDIAQRQGKLLSQMAEDNSTLAREMMAEGTPEEKMARNAEILRNLYERAIGNMQELSEIVSKSGQEASALLKKRVAATMNGIQDSLEKAQRKKAA